MLTAEDVTLPGKDESGMDGMLAASRKHANQTDQRDSSLEEHWYLHKSPTIFLSEPGRVGPMRCAAAQCRKHRSGGKVYTQLKNAMESGTRRECL